MGRYTNREIFNNSNQLYKPILDDKERVFIRQYTMPTMKYPTSVQIGELTLVGHIWTVGDSFWKLAHKFYGDVNKWYIIAWFNKMPTEHHINIGDSIIIPTPLDKLEEIFGT